MGKGKLAKFADMRTYPHVFEPVGSFREDVPFEMRGCWNSSFFHNDGPIVLELGCGQGEYTVGLAGLFPDKNFIGVDIKGARMWTGAKMSLERGMTNVAFLRTVIELIERFFAPGEVSEIWITFPDPQMKKATKRLTSTYFMERYRRILKPDHILSIKTHYEQQWLERGKSIKYIVFSLPAEGELSEPDIEIELDDYRSYGRSKRSTLERSK